MRSCGPLRRCRASRGFTLIEILIVVAIVGILAAILFPVFGSARETARTATCSSNLKQIYLGTQLYVQDNNGTYPNPGYVSTKCGWANLVYPYVKSTDVFQCPRAAHGEFRTGCPPDSEDGQDHWDGSYDFNVLRVGTRQFIRESLVGQPSKVMLFRDGSGTTLDAYGVEHFTEPGASFDNAYDVAVYQMKNLAETDRAHNEGLNICFADGHVKRLTSDQFAHRDLWLNTHDAEYNLRAP